MLFTVERQKEILEILERDKSISVAKLARLLYVSAPTVRRDLSALEQQGKVTRTHGGVVLRQSAENEIPLMLREDQNSAPKRLLAQKAASYIHDGDVIFLDASSTAAHLVPFLKKFNDLVVVTNSPKTSLRLGEESIKNYCTGGLLLAHSIAYVGHGTESFISNINADLFFFSSRGYTSDGYITDSSIEEATVKRAMLRNAGKAFYLCDNSKLDKRYMYNICHSNDVTQVIQEDAL